MKKIIILSIAVVILLLLSIILFYNTNNIKPDDSNIANEQTEAVLDSGYQSLVDEQAAVTVDITPKVLALGQERNIFAVAFNTHSVPMDYDFSQVIILRDDLDNVYSAQEWTGGRGGHHVSGEVIFPALDPQASAVEIDIVGVGGVDRVFKWQIL